MTVGPVILVYVAVRWFQRSRGRWLGLAPFVLSAAYGMLLILSIGGILGGAAGIALCGSNVAGDAALKYGVGGGTPEVTRTQTLALTDGGHSMVLIITAGMAAYWQVGEEGPQARHGPRRALRRLPRPRLRRCPGPRTSSRRSSTRAATASWGSCDAPAPPRR